MFRRSACLLAVKTTTGLVGLPVVPHGREVLIRLYRKMLDECALLMPASAGYRVELEAMARRRLKILESHSNENIRSIEQEMNAGQIEQVIVDAQKELEVLPELAERKIWEHSGPKPSFKVLG